MLPWIASQTVTRLRGTSSTDGYGDAGLDFTTPDSLIIEGCSVQPVVGDEYNQGRDAITSRWNLYAPADCDFTSLDRIEHNGIVYEVDGSVMDWPELGLGLDHRQALLKRVEG